MYVRVKPGSAVAAGGGSRGSMRCLSCAPRRRPTSPPLRFGPYDPLRQRRADTRVEFPVLLRHPHDVCDFLLETLLFG